MTYLYQIRVQGHLVDDWSDWFAGVQITRLATGETQLVGELDQTALHGVLARIRDLNLILIAVNQVDEETAMHEDDQQEQGGEHI
jgi:hypothetical protein